MNCSAKEMFAYLIIVLVTLLTFTPSGFAQTADAVRVGGSCVGECVPEKCPTGTVAQVDSCGCRGGYTNCKCKGTNKCYDDRGTLLETVGCTGACRWDRNAAPVSEELELLKELEYLMSFEAEYLFSELE